MTDFPPTANPASPPTAKALALEDWLVVLIMAALALITFANVLLRYFTDTSFAWTEEISIFLMIVLAMVGGSSAVARDQHIRIEFFSGNGSAQRRRRLARLGALMTALLFTLLAVLSVRLVWDDWRYEETSPGIGVPQWWYSMWLPICSVAIALRALGLFVRQGHPAAFAPEMIDGTEAAENTTAPAQTQKPQADQP
ncbi:MAG: TRAP transporter small permease [Comamonas sp.]|nr:TRAP transporter small permease [Comamonas sp.]